jgi:hypothetical protein
MIAHGELGGQAPAGPAMRVPMQFQMIDDAATGANDGLVLNGVKFGEFFGKDFLHVATQEFLFIAATATFDQGLVNGDISAARVFNEEHGVGNVIEKLLDNGQFGGNAGWNFRERTGKR